MFENNIFFITFAECLNKNYSQNPELYSKSYIDTLNAYKEVAFVKKTYDKNSKSIKDTCKILKIKNTYLAIDTALSK